MSKSFIQYGCGFSAGEGWRNYDASPTLRFERLPVIGALYTRNRQRFPANVRFGDIVKGLPEPAQSADGVYCSHILEHLALEDCRIALRNTLALLRPGGVFRLVVPDMEREARRYLEDSDPDAVIKFMSATCLGQRARRRTFRGFLTDFVGNSRHLWMWDFKGLAAELAEAGFIEIRRAILGDSGIPDFDRVEDPDRWVDCLGIHCFRADH